MAGIAGHITFSEGSNTLSSPGDDRKHNDHQANSPDKEIALHILIVQQ